MCDDIDASISAYDRTLKITWSYDLDGNNITGDEFTVIATPYAVIDEIIDELGL